MSKAKASKPILPLGVFLAWLIPGAGHIYLGRPVRGITIFVAITLTFWSGIALGGIMTIDQHYERWWFYGQMCTGVHGVVGWYRQHQVYAELQKDPDIGPIQSAAEGQVTAQQMAVDDRLRSSPRNDHKFAGLALVTPLDNAARAYTGIAGLLNLLCIFDVLALSLIGVRGEHAPGEDEPALGRGRREEEAA
jgi:TM2 domain-containing membrane protein YozV